MIMTHDPRAIGHIPFTHNSFVPKSCHYTDCLIVKRFKKCVQELTKNRQFGSIIRFVVKTTNRLRVYCAKKTSHVVEKERKQVSKI